MRRRVRFPLRQQMMISYLPLLVIPILVISLILRSTTERSLTGLVTNQGTRLADQLAGRFSRYYREHGSWVGVSQLLNDPASLVLGPQRGPPARDRNGNPIRPGQPVPATPPSGAVPGDAADGHPGIDPGPEAEQILLTDARGLILAANTDAVVGRQLSADVVARGAAIYIDNKLVGVLVVGAALGILDEAQKQLLENINTALLLSSLLSAGVSVAVGLWLSGQISAPIQALTRGARALAGDRWVGPIPVRANNELGELTGVFNQMAEDLTRQQTLRKQLIADIAHDLRTPLTVMNLEIEGIKAGIQTPAESAQNLQDEVIWLKRLVDDLHTLSQIDAGQLPIQSEPTNLNVLLESVVRHWSNVAEQEEHPLSAQIAANLPYAQIDSPRMRQVLGNLIQNALQHTPPGTLITLRAEGCGAQIVIEVIDSGPGIPADALPHLFERFYRVDRSRNRSHANGSGLGLSIAYQLTLLQGGTLRVESELGNGSRFILSLPALPG